MASVKQMIQPHFWFDKEAREAVEFYVSVFPKSKLTNEKTLHDTPSGDAAFFQFELWGQEFMAINGGPHLRFNPSISLIVNFDPARNENVEALIDEIWQKLADEGEVLMALGSYPFSEKYGWIQDKYGLSWQLILTNPDGDERPAIMPSILFVDGEYGKAEQAYQYYQTVFKGTESGQLIRYPEEMAPNQAGTIMFSDVKLENQWFVLMDSGHEHQFAFNKAISFVVLCDTQEEIDYHWDKLSADPEAERCGWLKDRFGVSWQIIPKAMIDMMRTGNQEQIKRVNRMNQKMKKISLSELEKVFVS